MSFITPNDLWAITFVVVCPFIAGVCIVQIALHFISFNAALLAKIDVIGFMIAATPVIIIAYDQSLILKNVDYLSEDIKTVKRMSNLLKSTTNVFYDECTDKSKAAASSSSECTYALEFSSAEMRKNYFGFESMGEIPASVVRNTKIERMKFEMMRYNRESAEINELLKDRSSNLMSSLANSSLGLWRLKSLLASVVSFGIGIGFARRWKTISISSNQA